MKHLLNTLYITDEETYLYLENENVMINKNNEFFTKIPLLRLEAINYFGYKGASPSLLGECAKRNIDFCFFKPNGKFLARVEGLNKGNAYLRINQYKAQDNLEKSFSLSKNFIIAKIFNSSSLLKKMMRNHLHTLDIDKIQIVANDLDSTLISIRNLTNNLDSLRGLEGIAAKKYFSILSSLIIKNKKDFPFSSREKHPPIGRVNALLSFGYILLESSFNSALESVGLDPYLGFMHCIHAGRHSLALDLMEELRSVCVDRFVLSLINNKFILPKHFIEKENEYTLLNEQGRKIFLEAWEAKKREEIEHPYLNEKVKWGLLPYVQALLLSRTLRGDIDDYPAFLWR